MYTGNFFFAQPTHNPIQLSSVFTHMPGKFSESLVSQSRNYFLLLSPQKNKNVGNWNSARIPYDCCVSQSATSRWAGTVGKTSCLKLAASQADLTGFHSPLNINCNIFLCEPEAIPFCQLLNLQIGCFPLQNTSVFSMVCRSVSAWINSVNIQSSSGAFKGDCHCMGLSL